MKWKTAISTKKDGEVSIRGTALSELIETHTFPEAAFLLMRGSMPNEKETAMFNALLVSCVEHGVEPPSAFVARSVASTGNDVNTSIAAGVLAISEHHGGAGEKAAEVLQSNTSAEEIVSNALKNNTRISGFGHPLYKDSDPRAEQLFKKAHKLGVSGGYCEKIQSIQSELEKQSGKKLPINIDGAHAAILSDMGFDWRLVKSFFILGRLPGIIAHVHEEMINEKPYRRINPSDVEYTGT